MYTRKQGDIFKQSEIGSDSLIWKILHGIFLQALFMIVIGKHDVYYTRTHTHSLCLAQLMFIHVVYSKP
jgi:hypothetical protein